jgi:translation machinery-associated protein 16
MGRNNVHIPKVWRGASEPSPTLHNFFHFEISNGPKEHLRGKSKVTNSIKYKPGTTLSDSIGRTNATMPSKLNKIQKLVTKKKGKNSKALHENSRDALRIRKASIRDDRVNREHKIRKGANEQWLNRVAWFKDHLPDTLHPFEKAELQAAAKEYLTHMDEEINQLQAERRSGRPATTRQQVLELAKDAEKKEYVSGLWVPNLQDEQTLIKLDAWQYDWLSLSNMGFIRIDSEGLVKEAQFPPNKAA